MYTQITTINKSIQLILDDNVNQLQAFGFGLLPFVPSHIYMCVCVLWKIRSALAIMPVNAKQ